MCGIAGLIDPHKADQGQWAGVVETMLDLMAHRGPDDRGLDDRGSVVLGHLRLSILDLSSRGHQPMTIEDGAISITYNGEVYNYRELREELEAEGVSFRSGTDTEVILQAYRRWGTDCFAKFNGMWSLAIWDDRKGELVLSRDRVGIKPLYVSTDGGKVVFASELKGVLAARKLLGLPVELNPDAIRTYLQSGLVDGLAETFIRNVHRFRAGHFAVISGGAVRSVTPYWDLPGRAMELRGQLPATDLEALAPQLYDLLGDAISKHIRADVPVGVCLSGGLDSSCVAGMASREIQRLNTYTAWFAEGEEFNELEHARRINEQFALAEHEIRVDGSVLLEKLPEMLWYLDEPTLAMGVYPQWHVMEAASADVKVVMDGQGGDELFAGYDFYAPHFAAGRLGEGDYVSVRDLLRGYRDNYGPDRAEQIRATVGQIQLSGAVGGGGGAFPGHLDNVLLQELRVSRLPALLRYEDRLSMAFSIESRVPLLDYRLIELAFAADESLKAGPGWSKHVFRKALEPLLPPAVTWRKDKKGFPTPMEVWLKGPIGREIDSLLSRPGGRVAQLTGSQTVEKLLGALRAGKADHWLLWRLTSLELWLENYLQRIDREVALAGRCDTSGAARGATLR